MKKRSYPVRLQHVVVAIALGLLGGLPARATLTFDCAASIDIAGGAGTCSTGLNIDIAGLYTNTFSDVNARIYIRFGNTGLGSSSTIYSGAPVYDGLTGYRAALQADRTSADDFTGFAGSVPNTSTPVPGAGNRMFITNANARALGGLGLIFGGVQSDAATLCSDPTVGNCYDGVITISNTASLWFRVGGQGASQYDFYTVVQHEVNEILGTASCAASAGCSNKSGFSPIDLYRYHSNGTRSFAAGDNQSCSDNTQANNACFALDPGIAMLLAFNNINNGQDLGDFASNCLYVQDAVGCLGPSGTLHHNIDPAAEIKMLDVIGYSLVVPEPGTLSLFGAGIGLLALVRRRR